MFKTLFSHIPSVVVTNEILPFLTIEDYIIQYLESDIDPGRETWLRLYQTELPSHYNEVGLNHDLIIRSIEDYYPYSQSFFQVLIMLGVLNINDINTLLSLRDHYESSMLDNLSAWAFLKRNPDYPHADTRFVEMLFKNGLYSGLVYILSHVGLNVNPTWFIRGVIYGIPEIFTLDEFLYRDFKVSLLVITEQYAMMGYRVLDCIIDDTSIFGSLIMHAPDLALYYMDTCAENERVSYYTLFSDGMTYLHIAAYAGNNEIYARLLELAPHLATMRNFEANLAIELFPSEE